MILILHPDGRVMPLELVTSVSVSHSAVVPKHPMEVGAEVSEHAHLTNAEYIFSCKVTESPTVTQKKQTFPAYGRSPLTGREGPARVWLTQEFLKDCVGHLVDVISTESRFHYSNVMLTKFPFEWRILRGSPFTIGFTEPRLVTPVDVRVPPRRAVPATVTDEEAEAEDGTAERDDFSDFHKFLFGKE